MGELPQLAESLTLFLHTLVIPLNDLINALQNFMESLVKYLP